MTQHKTFCCATALLLFIGWRIFAPPGYLYVERASLRRVNGVYVYQQDERPEEGVTFLQCNVEEEFGFPDIFQFVSLMFSSEQSRTGFVISNRRYGAGFELGGNILWLLGQPPDVRLYGECTPFAAS